MLATLPFFLVFKLFCLLGNADTSLAAFSQFFSLFPGKTGSYIRCGFYCWAFPGSSQNIYIGFGSLFFQTATQLDEGVYIGPQCNIGSCHIGANTLLGSGVHVMSGKGQHNFSDITKPIKEQGGEYSCIRIGADGWIGNGALIMANVGKGCVIGAGAVVTHDIPDYAIAAGNPAKVIKSRLE